MMWWSMVRWWYAAPLLVLAALGSCVYWWQLESDAWLPPRPRKPDLPQITPLPQPVKPDVVQALAKPLLWTARRPVEKNEKKTGLMQELMQSRLMAVFESGKNRVALLQKQNGTQLKLTSETKPWRIESFDGRNAVFLSDDDQRVNLILERSGSAPAGGPSGADRLRKF